MPTIDRNDSLTWPIGWRPGFVPEGLHRPAGPHGDMAQIVADNGILQVSVWLVAICEDAAERAVGAERDDWRFMANRFRAAASGATTRGLG